MLPYSSLKVICLDIVFGCHNPTNYPSLVPELSLLTQCSSITTLQPLVLEKQNKGAWPIMVLSMRIDNLTYLVINCGKAEP